MKAARRQVRVSLPKGKCGVVELEFALLPVAEKTTTRRGYKGEGEDLGIGRWNSGVGLGLGLGATQSSRSPNRTEGRGGGGRVVGGGEGDPRGGRRLEVEDDVSPLRPEVGDDVGGAAESGDVAAGAVGGGDEAAGVRRWGTTPATGGGDDTGCRAAAPLAAVERDK